MKTQLTKDCGTKKQPKKPCACAPCDIPPFCRTSYYTGKLLTARDFETEQQYHIDKLRLHHTALHGWGAVCGLTIKPHPHCPALKIVVEEGLAIDQYGREVRLIEDVTLDLPVAPPPQKHTNPCPPDHESHEQGPYDPDHSREPTSPHPKNLWVCLKYCEHPDSFSVAPFDECACTGASQKPNMVCERYCLELTEKEPDCVRKIREERECGCERCEDIYKDILDECRQPGKDCCIPLAIIHHFVEGEPVTAEMIDNWTHRPRLPSVHLLDRVVRCILDQLPRRKLTRITDINWTHGSELHCEAFMSQFIGHEKGLEITFENPVHERGINPRTFQAMVVYTAGGPEHPRRMEIAPAHIEVKPTHIRLRIDEPYARRHLDRQNFDLFITLKCDVILDHHGRAVDGNLLARMEEDGTTYTVDAPTGDGIPGGLFESWIRVRSEERRDQI